MSTKIQQEIEEQSFSFMYDFGGWINWAFDWGHGPLEKFTGLDKWQIDFVNELSRELLVKGFDGFAPVLPTRFTTASGHGIGKSALVAMLILAIMSTRKARGVVTAGTSDQLRTKTWPELAKWKKLCITGDWFDITTGKGSLSLVHKTDPEEWRVDAVTCKEENSDAFAGLHCAPGTPFYIFDEASAVPDKIWEVAEGGLTDGEPIFLAFGNPVRNTGGFRETFNDAHWKKYRIDSRQAARTNKVLINQWIEKYGDDSDFVRVRVKGEFPRRDGDQYIGEDVYEEAALREPILLGDEPIVAGLDVARGGEDYVYVILRRGNDAISFPVYRVPGTEVADSTVLIAKVAALFSRHNIDHMFVDATGIGGPIGDRLRQLGYPVTDVHFGGSADNKELYADKTSEMGFRCREWMMKGGAIPDSPILKKDLCDRGYTINDKGLLKLESKREMKKRLNRSPDWGDALFLTFASDVVSNTDREVASYLPRGKKDYDPLENA